MNILPSIGNKIMEIWVLEVDVNNRPYHVG